VVLDEGRTRSDLQKRRTFLLARGWLRHPRRYDPDARGIDRGRHPRRGIVASARQAKETLPLGDTTLLGWVVREAEASSLDRVVIVARSEVDTRRAGVVRPDARDTTCSASLKAGLAAVGTCDAVMLLLGDTPGVDASVINAVSAAWESTRAWALVTLYDEGVGHPLVFAAEALPSLHALHGEKAVWKLLESEPARVERTRIGRPLPRDVDGWDDYEALLRALA
jgi:molybdenum cofactor cytidylyltransferase